jgi:thiazole synthase
MSPSLPRLQLSRCTPPTAHRCNNASRCHVASSSAGCLSPHEAIKTACMARELFQTNLIKLEVIGDEVSLQPDPFGLVEAANQLVRLGFQVLPYCTEDWILCRRLMDVGCEVLMPWAAPIGTGQGPRNARALRELRERAPNTPLNCGRGNRTPVSRVPGHGMGIRRRALEYSCFTCG